MNRLTPDIYVVGNTIRFDALNKRRAGLVVKTGRLRIKARYTCDTGSTFERYLPVTATRLTPEAVKAICRSLDALARALARPTCQSNPAQCLPIGGHQYVCTAREVR